MLTRGYAGRADTAGGSTRVYGATPSGDIDGVNTIFTCGPFTVGTLEVLYNGVTMLEGNLSDYTISESVLNGGYDTITMTFPLRVGDQLLVSFNPV